MNSPLAQLKCQNCSINQLCLPVTLAEAEIEHLDSIVKRRKPYNAGDYLFRSGEELKALYAVRSGSLKSYIVAEDGTEQITGFHLPGEIVGLDAINTNQHQVDIKVLETSMVCAIPYSKLDELTAEIKGLRQQMMKVMSREITDDKELFFVLNKKSVDARLAAFILNLSGRYASRNLSRTQFSMVMTKADIANYLGMAIETISRIFTKLQKNGLIEFKNKQLTITDLKGLSQLAGTVCG